MKLKLTKISLIIISIILIASCSKNNVLDDYINTEWITEDNALTLRFIETDKLSIEGITKPFLDDKDIEKMKKYKDYYNTGVFENIKIDKEDDKIRIYNKDELDLTFEIIYENEFKDSEGNIFKKK